MPEQRGSGSSRPAEQVRTIGVAIPIPEPWNAQLVAERHRAGDLMASLVPPHVTLLPPTHVLLEDESAVEAHLRAAAAHQSAFEIQLRGSGTFRPITDVVFVAVAAGISECEQLQTDIRHGLLARELRYPYHPHVTVAHDLPAPSLDDAFERLADFEARFWVSAFTLFMHGEDGRWRPEQEFTFDDKR